MSRTVLVFFAALLVSALGSPVSSVRKDEIDVFFDKVNYVIRHIFEIAVYNQTSAYGPVKVTVDYLEIGGLDTWSQKGDYRQLNGTSDSDYVNYDFDVSFGLDQLNVNFSYYVHNLAPQLPGFRHYGNMSINMDYVRLMGSFNSHVYDAFGRTYPTDDCKVRLTGGELVKNPSFDVKITPENDLNNYIAQVLRGSRNIALSVFQNAPFLYSILSRYYRVEEALSYWACIMAYQ